MKAKGKCTTDHISAAGPWLKYRGHLENISGNLFLGAVNAFTGVAGEGKDQLDGQVKPFPDIAKHYHEAGQGWVAIGDENYGEGSSREHAAMEPRFRNAKVVIARCFARIHETNLKKQGVLPLTFADPATYDQIGEDDRISVLGLADLQPESTVRCRLTKPDGTTVDFDGDPDALPRADRLVQGRQRPQHHPPARRRRLTNQSPRRASPRCRRSAAERCQHPTGCPDPSVGAGAALHFGVRIAGPTGRVGPSQLLARGLVVLAGPRGAGARRWRP